MRYDRAPYGGNNMRRIRFTMTMKTLVMMMTIGMVLTQERELSNQETVWGLDWAGELVSISGLKASFQFHIYSY